MEITLKIENNQAQLLIDQKPCFPHPLAAPLQYEWLYQAIIWHLQRRGFEGHLVFFRDPFEEPPYMEKLPERKFSKPVSELTFEDLFG